VGHGKGGKMQSPQVETSASPQYLGVHLIGKGQAKGMFTYEKNNTIGRHYGFGSDVGTSCWHHPWYAQHCALNAKYRTLYTQHGTFHAEHRSIGAQHSPLGSEHGSVGAQLCAEYWRSEQYGSE
jgi:hypothetical protein